jgi:phospholipid-binding lipoprotein MlaA
MTIYVVPKASLFKMTSLTLLLGVSFAPLGMASNAVALTNGPMPTQDDAQSDLPKEDTLEGMNRFFFGMNQILDGLFLKPAAQIYDLCTPEPIQERLSNFLDNLGEPVTFANEMLQGRPDAAMQTLGRFSINSTLGVGGLCNAAYEVADLSRHKEDFGQTLAVWGVDSGPYLVLPALGPSSFRDLVGTGVEFVLDPISYVFRRNHHSELTFVRAGVDAVRRRKDVLAVTDRIDKTSADPYATYRVLYGQTRLFQINNGEVIYTDTPVLEAEESF